MMVLLRGKGSCFNLFNGCPVEEEGSNGYQFFLQELKRKMKSTLNTSETVKTRF
jgi:hypothetical protein